MIKNVEKKFDNVVALNKISLEVSEGEFCTLLGASGSGKTTLLRVIAGFEPIDNGSIQINGKNIETLSIANRNIGMVFQNYALFPHMSVRENVAFGLKMRKLNKSAIEKKLPVKITSDINNTDRSVGAMLSGIVAKKFGHKGLPDESINIKLKGTAGQSFGAWLARGVTLNLSGDANDYVGKGLSGGIITIKKDNKIVTSGGRVLAVSSSAETIELALQKSYNSIKKINFKNMNYRKDIGFDL